MNDLHAALHFYNTCALGLRRNVLWLFPQKQFSRARARSLGGGGNTSSGFNSLSRGPFPPSFPLLTLLFYPLMSRVSSSHKSPSSQNHSAWNIPFIFLGVRFRKDTAAFLTRTSHRSLWFSQRLKLCQCHHKEFSWGPQQHFWELSTSATNWNSEPDLFWV